MIFVRKFKVRKFERGLRFRDREFQGLLGPGDHWYIDPLRKESVEVVSIRDVWLKHKELDVIVASGALDGQAEVIDLNDNKRALVWINGRFEKVLDRGLHVLWTGFNKVRVEIVDAGEVRFIHPDLYVILKARDSNDVFHQFTVEPNRVGLYFRDGNYISTLNPGEHAFWKNAGKITVHNLDMRESVLDIAGQEIMTADKVSLRLNAVLTYRIIDPLKMVTSVDDARQALYRDAQLALRAEVGTRELDTLLSEKDMVARELEAYLKTRASQFGLEVLSLGIRDLILPGEMKALMNKVTEARKAAEANLITR
ncbi:MAG: slipin family protein, partial [Planctomycetota bacterium]